MKREIEKECLTVHVITDITDPFFQQFSFSYALCKTLMNWSCGSIEVTKTKKGNGKS